MPKKGEKKTCATCYSILLNFQKVVVIEETTVTEEVVDAPAPAADTAPESAAPAEEMIEETTVTEEVIDAEEPPVATPKVSNRYKAKSKQSPLSPARIQRLHEKEELQVYKFSYWS
jgi:hypothetical protein